MDERNHLFGNKTIREEKIDKHKVYNVSEMYIVTDTNKDFHSVNSKSTTEHDYKVSKAQTTQAISQELLQSSFPVNGFTHNFPIEDDHYVSQNMYIYIYISCNSNVQSNTLFAKGGYIK